MNEEIHMRTKVDLDRAVIQGYMDAADKELYVLNLLDTNEFDYAKHRKVKKHVDAVKECLEELSK